MGFPLDIYGVLIGDASINSYVGGVANIYGKRTLDNIDEGSTPLIVFDYAKDESTSTRSARDAMSTWNLTIYVSSKDINDVFKITDRYQTYLEAYTSNTINLISWVDEIPSYDDDIMVYYNDIAYSVIYTP